MAPYFRLSGSRILKRCFAAGLLVVSVASAQENGGPATSEQGDAPPAELPSASVSELDAAQALAQVAQKEDAAKKEQTADQAGESRPPPRADVAALRSVAAQIEALLQEKLSVDVEPATLFQIDLADPEAASLEARWLASRLKHSEQETPKLGERATKDAPTRLETVAPPPHEDAGPPKAPPDAHPDAADDSPAPNREIDESSKGAAEHESLTAAARLLDGRMREVRGNNRMAAVDRVAVLAALNLAHELQLLREENEQRDREMARLLEDLQRKLDGLIDTR